MPTPPLLSARALPAGADPAVIFAAEAAESAHVFWLDAGPGASTGWSLIGSGDEETELSAPGAVRVDRAPAPGDEPPFSGGWVGWHDYETGAAAAGAPVHAPHARPGWIRVRRAVAIDHEHDRLWALAEPDELDAWAAEIERRGAAGVLPPVPQPALREAVARHEPDAYAQLIERCRAAIRQGLAYQLCLTTGFRVPGAHDAVAVYRRLRAATPAHHGGFVRVGGTTLLSASPEVFLRTEAGRVITRPIKGTRPRDADPVRDEELAAELLGSAKERAENVMIVDLMRNDLSRVSTVGGIRVDGLWQVESYPAVHQLVSTVSAGLAPGATVADLWAAAFPAGSMTGAPKLSAMTLLHGLEGASRGIYSGCFGHIGLDGRIDLAMVIRSILIDGDGASVGAGGGITWGSVAAAEVDEVAIKAAAPLSALGAVLPASWRPE